ncbi:MAG: shikimate dehydrogenase [Thaumarchaeota archaeon]|nr:shikimate dehydrogenase [Nitrososphaerota archaeon]
MNSWKLPDSSTKLCCLIGYPVKQSPSPAIHNVAFQHLKINAIYMSFAVLGNELAKAVEGLRAIGLLGANVTMPHKEAVIRLLDDVDVWAKKIGAVNTVTNKDGKLIGCNTDADGFANPLKRRTKLDKLDAIIIGAGGAAKACAFALGRGGCREILILNRTISRAQSLAAAIKKEFGTKVSAKELNQKTLQSVAGHNLIVNATPLGMHEGWFKMSLGKAKLNKGTIAYDLVYRPIETDFLQEFGKLGATCIKGYEMLVEQAALSFEIWTGKKAPKAIMTEAALSAIGAR